MVSIHASAREATPGGGRAAAQPVRFNPRLRAGGDPPTWPPWAPCSRFNPRLRAGGDWDRPRPGERRSRRFNPRLRAGGDLKLGRAKCLRQVSIHASAREATPYALRHHLHAEMFQSTPPRGRRQPLPPDFRRQEQVSIHASAREATRQLPDRAHRDHVSIHASAREATRIWRERHPPHEVSIHASAREATRASAGAVPRQKVSIHASAREATRAGRTRSRWWACFNPRLRAGGDELVK